MDLLPDYAQPQLRYILTHSEQTHFASRVGTLAGSISYLAPHYAHVTVCEDFRAANQNDNYFDNTEVFRIAFPHLYLIEVMNSFCLFVGQSPPNGREQIAPYSILPHVYEDGRICPDPLLAKNWFVAFDAAPLTEAQVLDRHFAVWNMYLTTPMIYWDHPSWTPQDSAVPLSPKVMHLIRCRTDENYRSWSGEGLNDRDEWDEDDENYNDDYDPDPDLLGWGESGMQSFFAAWAQLSLAELLTVPIDADARWSDLSTAVNALCRFNNVISIEEAHAQHFFDEATATKDLILASSSG